MNVGFTKSARTVKGYLFFVSFQFQVFISQTQIYTKTTNKNLN